MDKLFLVNWLISISFCENNKWKIVSSPHYLNILIKSTKDDLSYSLKCDQRSMPKITYVPCFVPIDTELGEYFTKLAVCYSNQHYFGLNKVRWIRKYFYFTKIIQIWIKKCKFCEIFSKFRINRANTKQGTNVTLEIDLWSCLRL